MKIRIKYLFTSLIIFLLSINYIHASDKHIVYKIDIKKEINHTTQIYLKKGLEEAQKLNVEAILIHLNTYGGLLEAADSMRTAILYAPIPVYVYIDNNAASAGALISIACKKIFMRKGASIGAATVVGQTGEQMPDKYQSYMRSMMRATSESHGQDTIINGSDTTYKWIRDPQIAEAMVDDRTVIPNLIDSGKTLTLTAEEAVKWGYCDGIAESVGDVIENYLNIKEYKLETYKPTWLDNLMGFLMNPFFQSILIMIIIGGIYFELQTPGIGFPSVAALIAAILYFSPLYIEGLAANWEIVLFLTGLILIAFEVFVIPGFGITGISGTICVIVGLTLALVNNINFNFEGVSGFEIGRSLLVVLFGLTLGFGSMLWLSNKIGNKGIMRNMALVTDLENATSSPVLSNLVGKTGTAATVLRPSGKVIIDGKYYDGVSVSGFIEKGIKIKVIRFENAQVYVEEKFSS
ncbi:MAG: nodulation protein NfeD [Tannerella sp.]|jgi:membrane-bound serine protease (ClpP class)|nr:nodulation protein NfeD [Tannerella sp.]